MASTRLQGRAPSEPGFEIQRETTLFFSQFTTFGHFLQPTTTWIVLTKPSSALLCKKILAPSKVGLNRKRSDFSDLPNGLHMLSIWTCVFCTYYRELRTIECTYYREMILSLSLSLSLSLFLSLFPSVYHLRIAHYILPYQARF